MNEKRFSYLLEELKKLRDDLVEELRNTGGKSGIIDKKTEIDDAIKCLEFCTTYNLNTAARVIELPYVQAGYFEYRIMIDNETDDIQYWNELKDSEGNPITAIFGDLLVLNSETKKGKP